MRLAAISLLVLAAACTDDSASPTISDLTGSPTSMKVGQQVTMTGTMMFDDPDGNLAQLGGEITLPDQRVQELRMTDLAGVGSMKTGTLGWQMAVIPPMAGDYTLALWVTDADGNESNHLETTATATP